MSDYRSQGSKAAFRDGSRDVLFDGLPLPELHPCVDHDLLHELYVAAKSGERTACRDVINAALSGGHSCEDIADHYIPAASRIMGDAWCEDTASFAQVTIGTSRLQAALRCLGPDWVSDENAGPNASTVLLLIADGIYHTLGATVLAGQLRRRGVSVRIVVGVRPDDVADFVQYRHFDAVLLSASRGESLETLRLIVDAARKGCGKEAKIVVGGTILADSPDVQALTGADFATDEVDKAILFCGLKTKTRQTDTVKA